MNQMSQFDTMPDAGEMQTAQSPMMEPQKHTLLRSGHRPLVFEGTELCMAMSFSPKMPWWYEINIFRTRAQRFVVAVKKFYQSDQEHDIGNAWECETFADVMDSLETYDAADDVRMDVSPDDPKLSLPEMIAHALVMRAKASEARRQFKSLVGEILYDLENG